MTFHSLTNVTWAVVFWRCSKQLCLERLSVIQVTVILWSTGFAWSSPKMFHLSSKMLIQLYPQLSTHQTEVKNPLGWEAKCLGDLQVSWTTVQLWFWLKDKSGAPTNSMTLQFNAPRTGLQDPLSLPQPEVVGWLTVLTYVPSYKTSTPPEKAAPRVEGPLCRHRDIYIYRYIYIYMYTVDRKVYTTLFKCQGLRCKKMTPT